MKTNELEVFRCIHLTVMALISLGILYYLAGIVWDMVRHFRERPTRRERGLW